MNIVSDDEKYKKTPFLFLIASLVRNEVMDCANDNLKYIGKTKIGSWVVYSFYK
ncbi:hypothetical protein IJ425_06605 [bacterium]|nr:hypothetical protein [bacterium]